MHTDLAFILHKRAYRESSELIKLLTLNHGVIDVIAKGSRKPKSKFSGHLQPFLSVQVCFSGRSDLKTLTDAFQQGNLKPCGYKNQVSMLYCSELLTLLRFANDAYNETFNSYQNTIEALQQCQSVSLPLRKFEWTLSRIQGYELVLPQQANPKDFLQFDPHYGLQINNQNKICTLSSFKKFLNDKNLNKTELIQVNQLMKSVVNHLVLGKPIQSRNLL